MQIFWFNSSKKTILNLEKFHLLVNNHEKYNFVKVKDDAIQCEKSAKLLGIYIDRN